MGYPNLVAIPKEGDWPALQRAIAKLAGPKLGPGASPTFNSLTLTGGLTVTGSLTLSSTTASRLLATDGSKNVVSTSLFNWVAGTTNQITVADDADGTITLSTPQDIHTGASPTFADLTLSAPVNIYALSHDSFTDFVSNEHIDHTTVSITGGGILSGGGDITESRTITLAHGDVDHDQTANVHQDVNTTANPTFDGINLTDTDDLMQIGSSTALMTAGTANLAFGIGAGKSTWGSGNTCFGLNAGNALNGANYSLLMGAYAGAAITDGEFNVGLGYGALQTATVADYNVAIGYLACNAQTAGNAVAIGAETLKTNVDGVGNIAIGSWAMRLHTGTGNYNIAIGSEACYNSTTAGQNIGIGYNALYTNQTGVRNTAVGSRGLSMVTGDDGTVMGYWAARNATGNNNTCVGVYNIWQATTSENNTTIGAYCGYSLSTGDGNNFIGNYAGYRQTTNSNLLIIDNQLRSSAANEQAQSIIYGVMAAAPANQTLQFNADILFGVGGGLAFGSFKGNEIAWTQASAAQDTYYTVSDSDITAGQLNGGTTFDNNQEITVPNTGYYLVIYYVDCEVSIAGKHVLVSLEVNGTEVADGRAHIEIPSANQQRAVCGTAILSLSANDAVSIGISTTDTGTPDLLVDHIGLTVVQIGG